MHMDDLARVDDAQEGENMKKSVVIRMQGELEARPIANLVQVANRYNSQIYLEEENRRVNAKSIMGMMSFGLMNGETIVIDAEGEDEKEAIAALEKILTE